jgi:hypothetical protein
MSKVIHTIRVFDKSAHRCHVIFGEDQSNVIARAKAATTTADRYEIEQWRIKGDDPTAEHGTWISGYATQTL